MERRLVLVAELVNHILDHDTMDLPDSVNGRPEPDVAPDAMVVVAFITEDGHRLVSDDAVDLDGSVGVSRVFGACIEDGAQRTRPPHSGCRIRVEERVMHIVDERRAGSKEGLVVFPRTVVESKQIHSLFGWDFVLRNFVRHGGGP